MSDRELHDLLHERVADLTMPDVSERAWGRARRIRRRRTTAAVAGAVAAVVVTAVVVDRGAGLDRSERPLPPAATRPAGPTADRRPGSARPGLTRPDGRYRGWRVYWGPTPGRRRPCRAWPRRSRTPSTSPRPRPTWRTGRSARPWPPTRSSMTPAGAAPAAGPRRVPAQRRHLAGRPAGRRRRRRRLGGPRLPALARRGSTSPSRRRAACWCSPWPPAGGARSTPVTATTTALHVDGRHRAVAAAAPARAGGGPLYSVLDGARPGPAAPGGLRGAVRRRRRAVRAVAAGPRRADAGWAPGAGAAGAARRGRARQAVLVDGITAARDALLALREGPGPASGEPARADLCCGVAFWLRPDVVAYGGRMHPGRLLAWRVGTHDVRRVTTIAGYDPDRQFVDASYAEVCAEGAAPTRRTPPGARPPSARLFALSGVRVLNMRLALSTRE